MNPELDVEFPVSVLQIGLPDNIAVKIETEQVTGSDKSPDMFAIGDRRGSSGIISFVASCFVGSAAEFVTPEFFALCIERDQVSIFAFPRIVH